MEDAISKVDEIEKDNDVSVPDFIQIGDTCIEKSYITETPAQISYLSMKTDAGKNVAWFYEKTKNLNIDMSSINVFMDKGVFRIIIPCDKLTMDQCIDLVTLATEANIEMCHSLDSLYLLEHKKPMTKEAISFIGETDFTL